MKFSNPHERPLQGDTCTYDWGVSGSQLARACISYEMSKSGDSGKKRMRTAPTGDTPKQAGKIPRRVSPARSPTATYSSISKTPTEPRHCGSSLSRIPVPCECRLKGKKDKLSFDEEVVGSMPPVSSPCSRGREGTGGDYYAFY